MRIAVTLARVVSKNRWPKVFEFESAAGTSLRRGRAALQPLEQGPLLRAELVRAAETPNPPERCGLGEEPAAFDRTPWHLWQHSSAATLYSLHTMQLQSAAASAELRPPTVQAEPMQRAIAAVVASPPRVEGRGRRQTQGTIELNTPQHNTSHSVTMSVP